MNLNYFGDPPDTQSYQWFHTIPQWYCVGKGRKEVDYLLVNMNVNNAGFKRLRDSVMCVFAVKTCVAALTLFSSLCRYILASFYTKYDPTHFLINTSSLLSVLLPKLPQFHGVRIFGINKY